MQFVVANLNNSIDSYVLGSVCACTVQFDSSQSFLVL